MWARRLAKREGIFTGGSAADACRRRCASRRTRKKGDLIVAFLPDTGSRYLSKIFNDGWMREHGYADSEVTLTAADVIRVKHQNGKTREPIIVGPNHTIFHALNTMQQQDISQLPCLRGRSIGRHGFRGSDSESRAAGQRSAQAHRARSDGPGHAAGAVKRAGRARDVHL